MTLADKFKPYCDHEYANREDNAENCVEVAEAFAIAFWEWRRSSPLKNINQYTNAETLKMFKQEKGH